jgi:hypothetical protein
MDSVINEIQEYAEYHSACDVVITYRLEHILQWLNSKSVVDRKTFFNLVKMDWPEYIKLIQSFLETESLMTQ